MSEIKFGSLKSRRSTTQRGFGPNNRRGAILVLVAVSIVGFMGVMALAVEAGSFQRIRRVAQTAADAGAIAGASEIGRDFRDSVTTSANAEATRNGFADGTDGVTVSVYNGPISGLHIGDDEFVEVVVTRTVSTIFGGLLGRNSVTVHARGVAGYAAPNQGCLFTLEPDDEKALNVSSASRLSVSCGVVVNSNDPAAVLIESAGSLTANSLGITGGIDLRAGTVTISPGTLDMGVPASPDPLVYLERPTFSATQCDFTNTKVDSHGVTAVLNPGIYCGGIEITSNGTALLNPGLYILRGGGLRMGGGQITGTGVSFFNTNATAANGGADKFGKIEMGSQSRANLSAMTTGPLARVLFFQDPAGGKPGDLYENVIGSGSNAVFTGTLYFPTQPVEIGASNSTTTLNGGVVATTVKVTSNSHVNLTPTGGLAGEAPIKRISLVE